MTGKVQARSKTPGASAGLSGDLGAMTTTYRPSAVCTPMRPGAEEYQRIPSLVQGKRVPWRAAPTLVSKVPPTPLSKDL